jgi:ferric-dicitrate binding protein FerR (iron transport regulator)
MLHEKAKELLIKYKAGKCTDAEKALVEKWLFQYQDEELDLSEERIAQIGQEIWLNLPQPQLKIVNKSLWLRMAAAAAVLVFLSTGLYFMLNGSAQTNTVVYKTDIKPGTNKAILTLASGKTILLTGAKNGELASDGNAVISKAANGEVVYSAKDTASLKSLSYNTMTIPRSGQYHLVLADGTNVWLNAASSIKYPTVFSGNERKVEITGEAYFEVAHNAAKPFRVVANGEVVEVLGTHFNVNAYADEPVIKTTLLEGSVKVTQDRNMAMLIPGQQAQVNRDAANSAIRVVENADTDEATAWKNGLFQFNKASIESIMRQASRWYNVEVSYSDNKRPVKTFTGSISRNTNLSQLLEILSYAGSRFEIDGKKIIVKTE